jgi:hypothetical protein
MVLDRRVFLGTATGLAGLRSVVLSGGRPGDPAVRPPQRPSAAATGWDLTWLDQLKGRHKQLFDVGNMDISEDTPLRVPMNYLDAFRDVFHLEPPEVNVVIGIQRGAFPMNASDAIWEKYNLAERWNIKDPRTGKLATNNIFLGETSGGPGATVRPLQARGAIFWQCNVALQAVTGQLARATGKPAQEIRAELVAGLNPGVKLVPAHTLLVGLVQERGFTYEKP